MFYILLFIPCILLGASHAGAKISLDPATEISPELRREEAVEAYNFFRHRENYFLGGHPNSKVQLSLKVRPILDFELYFAYTQQMFWKITSDSRPFKDISFNPEIYYEWHRPQRFVQGVKWGLEHKSNGKDEEESRSLDNIFTEINTEFGWQGMQILWDTRFFWIFDIDWQTNADIKKFTGFWHTRLTVKGLSENFFPAKTEFYMQFYPGGEFGTKTHYGALEAGIKLRARLFNIMPYIMFQYYYGYMESLLTYNTVAQSYRIGFLF
ncbi:MAG: phospholipase A [Oligoflexus sp.]